MSQINQFTKMLFYLRQGDSQRSGNDFHIVHLCDSASPQLATSIAAMMERLTTEQRRALALLTSAGRDGMTQSLLTTLGFDASVIAGLVNEGLATQTLSRGRADGNTDFVRIRIKAAGRRAIKG